MLGPDPDAIGVDYAIGSDAVARAGARAAGALGVDAAARGPASRRLTTYFAAPDHRNAPSLRVLAKAGFTEGCGSTSRRRTATPDTVVGCTLDVASVIG